MPKVLVRMLAVVLALMLIAPACSDDNKTSSGTEGTDSGSGLTDDKIDYDAIGLWDDGPCDPKKDELKIGLMTVFESPILSLKDQATALEAAAEAFNARGGANGSCVKVFTCDDQADTDQALACVRDLDGKDIVASVNDTTTAAPGEVADAMRDAGIPRVAANVFQQDWDDPNAYPLDASSTGSVFLMPSGLVDQGVKKIGSIRVNIAEAAALIGLLEGIYEDEGATFVSDTPVPPGTSDYTQFIVGAERAGAEGVILPLGPQESVQVVKAGQQVGTDLKISSALGTFAYEDLVEFGDFAEQVVLASSFPPATFDLPVYKALRQDLAASGDAALQPEAMRTSPMRSWIGLYALLKMIRDAKLTTFTREGMTEMLKAAKDVPMLDMFGGENWTPDTNHEGLFKRAGMNQWAVWNWDPNGDWNGEKEGNFVKGKVINWDELMCGSIFGAPPETC
jgi:ABC-type branched-subunit amino acid transport system substrate-binding protein